MGQYPGGILITASSPTFSTSNNWACGHTTQGVCGRDAARDAGMMYSKAQRLKNEPCPDCKARLTAAYNAVFENLPKIVRAKGLLIDPSGMDIRLTRYDGGWAQLTPFVRAAVYVDDKEVYWSWKAIDEVVELVKEAMNKCVHWMNGIPYLYGTIKAIDHETMTVNVVSFQQSEWDKEFSLPVSEQFRFVLKTLDFKPDDKVALRIRDGVPLAIGHDD